MGKSSSAEYQLPVMAPSASSPICCSSDFVDRREAAEDLHLVAVFPELTDEFEAVRAGVSGIDGVEIGLELGDVAAVVRRVERGKQLLHDLAAVILEHALEPGHVLVAEREVVGDHRGALVAKVLGGVFAERMARLRRRATRAHEPWIGLALGHVLRAGNREDRRAR